MKSGRLSKEEWDFIKLNHTRLSYIEMAQKLDRSVDSIRKFVEKRLGKNLVTVEDRTNKAEYDIVRRPYWAVIQQQFTKDELEMFKFHWARWIGQFKDDVYPTEELQIVDAIKFEILMNRLLTASQENSVMVAQAENLLSTEKAKGVDNWDTNLIITLQDQIATLRAAQESIYKEYRELQSEKNKLLDKLKGTREARIKHLENSKVSFMGWLSEIVGNTEMRRSLGIRMEKMRLAMEQEKKRLATPHTYEDKAVDIPFLNAETLDMFEKDNK